MTASEILAAKEQYPGMIWFKLVRGEGSRLVVMPKEGAKKASKTLPGWTFGSLHMATVRLQARKEKA